MQSKLYFRWTAFFLQFIHIQDKQETAAKEKEGKDH